MKYQSTVKHCTTSRAHVLGLKTSNRLRDSHWARLHSTWCEMALRCGKAQMAREKEAAALPPSELVHFESENRARTGGFLIHCVQSFARLRRTARSIFTTRLPPSPQENCPNLDDGRGGERDLAGPCHKAGGGPWSGNPRSCCGIIEGQTC